MKPNILKGITILAFVLFYLIGALFIDSQTASADSQVRPNIILIMTDDMGYSDLGCYGGEIETPNHDRLASAGLRFTQFYNTGRCCPTRASLLTGLYPHQAGMGHMTGDRGPAHPGYRGRIMPRAVTVAEVLGPAGYHCFVTGKWHVGAKEQSWWPLQRGFDRFLGVPQGGGFFFKIAAINGMRQIVRDNEVIFDKENDTPDGWYATDAWTTGGLEFVNEAVEQEKPFFWYLPYNAPHWPLQALEEDIQKYRGEYLGGWDEIRRRRYKKQIELGLIDPQWKLSPRAEKIPAWETLSDEEKDLQDLRMATYAAMIDRVDQNVGRIVAELTRLGQLDNTILMFLQDNGGCAEGGVLGSDRKGKRCGTPMSYSKYGECWANVSDTPFRRYKHWVHEGGISTPLVVHWPAGIEESIRGELIDTPSHLIDLMATCVDLSGAKYPNRYADNKILPLEGRSLQPIFKGETLDADRPIYFEHEGNRGVRQGKWKLVAVRDKAWELYDMDADRSELNDLSGSMPEKLGEMIEMYKAWTERCMVE